MAPLPQPNCWLWLPLLGHPSRSTPSCWLSLATIPYFLLSRHSRFLALSLCASQPWLQVLVYTLMDKCPSQVGPPPECHTIRASVPRTSLPSDSTRPQRNLLASPPVPVGSGEDPIATIHSPSGHPRNQYHLPHPFSPPSHWQAQSFLPLDSLGPMPRSWSGLHPCSPGPQQWWHCLFLSQTQHLPPGIIHFLPPYPPFKSLPRLALSDEALEQAAGSPTWLLPPALDPSHPAPPPTFLQDHPGAHLPC